MHDTDFDVKQLANLARVNLTDEEIVEFSRQLPDILAYVDQLQKVDTEGVEETAQVTGLLDVLRPDEGSVVSSQYSEDLTTLRKRRDELLAAVPVVEQNMVKVPAVLAD